MPYVPKFGSGVLCAAGSFSQLPSVLITNVTITAPPPSALTISVIPNFGNVVVGATSDQTVTVTNSGTTSVTLSNPAITFTSGSQFSVSPSGTTCNTGNVLLANGACTIKLLFTPSAVGTITDTVKVNYIDSNSSPQSLSATLSGTGILPKLIITKVTTQIPALKLGTYRFTTAAGENVITVTTDADSSIPESSISYSVTEVGENYNAPTPGVFGRVVSIPISHKPLVDLIHPRFSFPLQYKIVASATVGTTLIESEPFEFTQDIRSQIRQEYVDKAEFCSSGHCRNNYNNLPVDSFTISPPTYSALIDASHFSGSSNGNVTFSKFASGNYDFRSTGLAVVEDSKAIAELGYAAVSFPIEITSGFRNPRFNDFLGASAVNSRHQKGGAVDFIASADAKTSWPTSIIKTPQDASINALYYMYFKFLEVFPAPVYYVFLENGNHVHVEKK